MRKILILLAFFAVLFFLTSFGTFKPLFNKSDNIAPNILNSSEPVTTFSGIVEKVNGNFITVSQEIYPTPSVINNSPYPSKLIPPSLKPIKYSYRVEVNQNTIIERPPVIIHYLFTAPDRSFVPKLTIKDIAVGRSITVNTDADLRLVINNQFTATKISLPTLINGISGNIINVKDNILTLKADISSVNPETKLPDNSFTPNKEINYQIKVTDNTEIARVITLRESPRSPKVEKLTFSDLKKNMHISVYTFEDIAKNRELTALQIIEPIFQPPLPL